MNKSTLFMLFAILCFSIQNVTLEMKLSKFNPVILSFIFSITTLIASVIHLTIQKTNWISGERTTIQVDQHALLIIIAIGIIMYAGQLLFLYAYNSGGKAEIITTLLLLMPVFIFAIKYYIEQNPPTTNQIVGFAVIAVGMIIFMHKSPIQT